jgi:N-acetylmuramoyl-L-alanine amidase
MVKISWDAGHAGFGVTPGKRALDNSMYEWDFNDGVVRYAMDALSHYEVVEQLRVDALSGRVDASISERANN